MPSKFKPTRIRKRKVLDRLSTTTTANPHPDPNAPCLPTETEADRATRRSQMRTDLLAQQNVGSKMSSKKQKRLEKYIETKLRREENVELMRKLGDQKMDTSLLRSMRDLGKVVGGADGRRRRIVGERGVFGDERETDDVALGHHRMGQQSSISNDTDGSSCEEDEAVKISLPAAVPSSASTPVAFGGGLKRPLELDGEGRPLIKKRKRAKRQPVQFSVLPETPIDDRILG